MFSIKCRKCREPLAFEVWERGELIDLMIITDHLCDKVAKTRPDGDIDYTCLNCSCGWVASP